ncbi:SDR family NAD(P)-dependent oxidoreductase [Actinomycetospora sp. C-140]
MSGQLQGKVAVITGTGGGMGREAALTFAREGAKIVGCDLKVDGNLETVDLVESQGGEMTGLQPLDLFDESEVERVMATAEETYGGIDILYNNAGVFRKGTIEEQSYEDFEFSLRAEVSTVFLATKHAVPRFRRRGGGSIINVGSIAGILGTSQPGNLPGSMVHCLTKAAVIRFTEVAAIELSPLNVRVNVVSPGVVLTPQLVPFIGESGDNAMASELIACGVVPRVGRAEDVVSAALFLAGDGASYITGANLSVDGGWRASGGRGVPDPRVAAALSATVPGYGT